MLTFSDYLFVSNILMCIALSICIFSLFKLIKRNNFIMKRNAELLDENLEINGKFFNARLNSRKKINKLKKQLKKAR